MFFLSTNLLQNKAFIVIYIILVIFFATGLVLSIKNRKKEKKLQSAADYNYITKNGNYKFKYMIKGFNNGDSKRIKIVINPELGFSDLAFSSTNKCNSAIVVVKGKFSGKIKTEEYNLSILTPNFTIDVENELANEELEIEIITIWTLGGIVLDEKLNFTYSK